MCVCVCVCVCVWFLVLGREDKSIFKWIGQRGDLYCLEFIIHFVLSYEYVSILMLSSENIKGTRTCWGVILWHLNSLVFVVWMVFSWLRFCLFYDGRSFLFLRVFLLVFTPHLLLMFDTLCVCVCVCVCVNGFGFHLE